MLVLNESTIRERFTDAARDAGLSVITEDESGTLLGPDGSFAVPRAPERVVEIPTGLAFEPASKIGNYLLSRLPHAYRSILFRESPIQIGENPPTYIAWFMKVD